MAKVINVKRNKIESVTLELDADELTYLCTVLMRTGGDPQKSLRRHADSIIAALAAQGIEIVAYEREQEINERYGRASIYFKDGNE